MWSLQSLFLCCLFQLVMFQDGSQTGSCGSKSKSVDISRFQIAIDFQLTADRLVISNNVRTIIISADREERMFSISSVWNLDLKD